MQELSKRQAEVLRLIQLGFNPRKIANLLGTSTQAVYKHKRRLQELGELPREETG